MSNKQTDDKDDILQAGESKRFSLMMLDGQKPGFRFADTRTDDGELAQQRAKNAEVRDYYKAQESAAWKGGLETGDVVPIRGKLHSVEGRDEQGKVLLRAYDSAAPHDTKEAAYSAYKAYLNDAWRSDRLEDHEIEVRYQTGDAKQDAYLAYIRDLTEAWRS